MKKLLLLFLTLALAGCAAYGDIQGGWQVNSDGPTGFEIIVNGEVATYTPSPTVTPTSTPTPTLKPTIQPTSYTPIDPCIFFGGCTPTPEGG